LSESPPVSPATRPAPSRLASVLLWVAAFLMTAASLVYQRTTGPTYPVRGKTELGGATVPFKLPRTHPGAGDAEIRLAVQDAGVTGALTYRRFRSHDEWRTVPLRRDGEFLMGAIPHQPPAGKVMYRIALVEPGGRPVELTDEPVIIRFRGEVPAAIVITHVVTIFAGALIAMRAGMAALRRGDRTQWLSVMALVCLTLGGLVFGPIMQKYSFGAFWTGWPYGHDLTDNKLAVAVIAWFLATWRAFRKPPARGWVLAAALITLAVWLIPHSVLGSELDYTKLPAP
jgi:hypothetical protein